MEIKPIRQKLSVCRLADLSQVNLQAEYCFLGKTDEELSLVCGTDQVPENAVAREDGWLAFRIQGVLDFSLVGILSDISALLAREKIGIFAVSTYNTDYILTKEENFERALAALERAGYRIVD